MYSTYRLTLQLWNPWIDLHYGANSGMAPASDGVHLRLEVRATGADRPGVHAKKAVEGLGGGGTEKG